MDAPVQIDRDQSVTRLLLARPEKRNILSYELVEALNAALDEVRADSKCRVVVLGAQGVAFCAGMDLKSIALDDPSQAERFSNLLASAYRRLLTLPMPLLTAVDGPAMGGAVGLALAGDLIFAGPAAKFAFPETRLGVVPALVSVVARRRLSPGKLMALALTGIESNTHQAVELGLADFAASENALAEAVAFAAKLIRGNSDEAMRRTKAFLRAQLDRDLEIHLRDALIEFQQAVATKDCAKGLAAFRGKTQPKWMDPEVSTHGA